MKRLMKVFAVLSALFMTVSANAGKPDLPDSIYVGGQLQHVQGIALDQEKGCMYMSFTSRFLKVDMNGRILASIDRIQGHLGAMTFNHQDRKVYASLECKDDEIGQNIAKKLNVGIVSESRFYIAIIDVDKMTSLNMDPENNDVLKTVCLLKPCEDYKFSANIGGQEVKHLYGCSGIDGVAIGREVKPLEATAKERSAQKMYLYVGYGIYGDVKRTDNDYQVIQRYDLAKLDKLAKPMIFGESHVSGPKKPEKEYFIYTGNTNYGVQNLTYDPYTDCLFMAVYKGKKEQFPNYALFAVSMSQKPFKASLKGAATTKKMLQLALVPAGGVNAGTPSAVVPMSDTASGVTGWRFKWGSTGLCPLGDGYWYISENSKDKYTKKQVCNARLYKWTGTEDAFVRADRQ